MLLMASWCLALAACAGPQPVAEDGLAPTVANVKPSTEAPAPKGAEKGFTREVLYRLLVGEIGGQRGELSLAGNNYLEAARITRDPAIAERATRIAVVAQDEKKALEAAALWTAVAPEALSAKQVYAALLIRAGHVDDAVKALQTLLSSLGPSSEQGLDLVGDMLSREQDKKVAVEVMERLVSERANDPHALFALALLLARTGDQERAIEVLKRVLANDPKPTRAVVFYAHLLQSQGNTAKALTSLEDAVESDPEAQDLRMAYARLLVDAKRYEEARKQFERLLQDAPQNGDVRYALALLLLQTNHPAEARTQFETLIKLGKRTRTAYFYLGKIAESQQDFEAATDAYRNVDRGEHYLDAQVRVAVLLAEAGRVPEARQHLHSLPRRGAQESILIYRAEAELLSRVDELPQAMSVYNLALDEHPGDSDLLYGRAMLAEKMNRLDILEQDLREVLSREPDNADALNALGYTLADRSNRYDEALALIERALALKPNDYYVLDSMGWVLYRLGRYEEAIDYLKRALALQDDPEIAAHLGEVLWVTGNRKAAREVWNSALENTPDDKRLLDVIRRFKP